MRRTQNVPKRIAVAILAASMAMTPVAASVTCPMVAFAEVVADNPEGETKNVNADETMNQNNGTVVENNGAIIENNATVTNNFGTVQENNGTVTNNFGTVEENNYIVTNNYAETENVGNGNGTVMNQFYAVSVSFSNTSSSYGDGFTDSPNSNDTNHYIKVTSNGEHIESSGVVTIAPSEGYQLGGENSANNNLGYSYTLERSGNNYVLTIINPEGSVSIVDPQTIGLVVSAIQNVNPDPAPLKPSGDNGSGGEPENPNPLTMYNRILDMIKALFPDNIPRAAVDINSSASSAEIAPASTPAPTPAPTPVGVSPYDISDRIDYALWKANKNATVLDIDLGNEPSLTSDHLTALLESTRNRNLFAKRCHFTHNGKKYVLFVPAKLDDKIRELAGKFITEPHRQAGPMRLAELFADYGFKLIEE